MIYIISIFFFLVWTILCAVAPNIQSMLVGRFLAGLSGSGFLTVSGGTVADLFTGSQIQAPMMLFTIVRSLSLANVEPFASFSLSLPFQNPFH
jgi:predicted MFS family arabinose efflux permease